MIPSNGIHSNGFSSAIILKKYKIPSNLKKQLLKPQKFTQRNFKFNKTI